MATRRLPILGPGTVPDTSGSVFFESYTVKATNDVWGRLVGVFNDTGGRIGLRGGFDVPGDYVGAPQIVAVWTTTVTTGNVVWDVDYRAVGGDDLESLDQAGVQESVTVTDAAPSAAHERLEVSAALTAGNLAAGDTVLYELFRDGADAADTAAAAALLFGLFFEYSDA